MTAAFFVMAVGALGLGALTYYVQQTPDAQRVPSTLRKADPAPSLAPVAKPEPGVSIRRVVLSGDDAVLSAETVAVPKGRDPVLASVDAALASLGFEAIRVVGVEKLPDGVLALDFNASIESGMGSDEESLFLRSLQLALGQFPDVQSFRLRVEGRDAELGHSGTSEPIRVIR